MFGFVSVSIVATSGSLLLVKSVTAGPLTRCGELYAAVEGVVNTPSSSHSDSVATLEASEQKTNNYCGQSHTYNF